MNHKQLMLPERTLDGFSKVFYVKTKEHLITLKMKVKVFGSIGG